MRTSNPALSTKLFEKLPSASTGEAMTVDGTINKTLILFGLLMIPAIWIWNQPFVPVSGLSSPILIGSLIGGLVLAMVTVFKKTWAPVTAPIFALVEGVVIGALSSLFELSYPGIVTQAVALTFGVMGLMLFLYRSGIIQVTEKFRLGVVASTGAVFLVYAASFVLGFFGVNVPYIHEGGPIGIGISLVIVGIAALNLVLDFDLIHQGAQQAAPRYMEWYGAFGLMVTMIWLYLELLRLLGKLRR